MAHPDGAGSTSSAGIEVIPPVRDLGRGYEDNLTEENLRCMGKPANNLWIVAVEDEDEVGVLFRVRICLGGPQFKPVFELTCRHLDFRQLKKEEASLFEREMKRPKSLRQLDASMTE